MTTGCDAPRPVQLLVGDQQLVALYWEPPRRMSPAVLLLPAEGEKKEDWIPLGTELRKEGYGVLVLEWNRQGDTEREQVLADVRAGFAFLREEKKVDAARIGIIGEARGASAALDFAAREPLARLVVLLSPSVSDSDAAGDPRLRDYGARPLLIAAEDDAAAFETARRLAAAAQGEAVVTRLPAAESERDAEILAFLRPRL